MELITNPAILFLDEPTSGLDTANAYKVARLMADLGEAGGRGKEGLGQTDGAFDLVVV
jgi:ABC-type multidrug transport system ATPase subunit